MFLKFQHGKYYAVIYHNGKPIWRSTKTTDKVEAEAIGKSLELQIKGETRQKIRIAGENIELDSSIIENVNRLCKFFPKIARSRVIEHIFLKGLEQVNGDLFLDGGKEEMQEAMRILHKLSTMGR